MILVIQRFSFGLQKYTEPFGKAYILEDLSIIRLKIPSQEFMSIFEAKSFEVIIQRSSDDKTR